MSFYRWIVGHPIAVFMVTTAVMVFGLVSYAQLPLTLMPDISYPTLTVRTEYAGAAPEEVESQISRPIEEALSTVEGLVEIESRSRAGVSDVVLEFDWEVGMNSAVQDVRERLQTTPVPEGAERPLILRYDPSLDPILRIALSAHPKKGEEPRSLLEVREYAEKELKRALETLPGVAAVTVRGGLERRIFVEPHEDWLRARGITLAQLASTLASENVNLAGGIVREGQNEYLIRTLNELKTLDDVRALGIRRLDGTTVPVGDVATVREGTADREVLARLDGEEAVEVEVYKEADANIVTTARGVKAALEGGLSKDSGLRTRVLDDQARFIEAALSDLVTNGVLGGLLAVLVTFVFLRDWLTTAIISTAIPICLVVTYAVMYVGGTSLNLMSLGGLALGVSMVIDSGTVVLENIQNHIDKGKTRAEAAVAGSSEVATAVFASVLTGMAVFFPIVFVEGIAGQIFGDLALTVVFSLAASLAVALLFIPMLAALQFSAGTPPERARDILVGGASTLRQEWSGSRWFWRPWVLCLWLTETSLRFCAQVFVISTAWVLRAIFWVVSKIWRVFDRVTLVGADVFLAGYGRAEGVFARFLAAALARPAAVIVGAFVCFALSVAAFRTVGSELIPEVHQGRFTVHAALPVGTPLARTSGLLTEFERRVRALPDVESVYSVVGVERSASSSAEEGEHTARVLVEILSTDDLEIREDTLMDAIRAIGDDFDGMVLRFQRPALFSFRTPIEVVLYGLDLKTLRSASDTAHTAISDIPGLADVRTSLSAGYPEVQVRYNRARLDSMGLAVGQVAETVRQKVQGEDATRISDGERRVDLTVRLDEGDRDSVGALGAINVNPRLDPPIRLDSVAELVESIGPSEIRRIDQRRAVVLSAALTDFDLSGAAARVEQALDRAGLPPGIEIEMAGQNREMDRSLASLSLALALAVFLVYVIMASTFESVRDPFIILFSVPLALVGVSFGLLVTGTPVSVVVFIGLIVLAGVVVANAIVLVDAINRIRDEGVELNEAIQQAAALRLRPILITALNSVLGLLPLAFGYGEGAEMQRPMAITIIFGLASSTVLTLVVVPVVYRMVSGRRASSVRGNVVSGI